MGMTNFYQGSLRYDIHGRKRKTTALKKASKPKFAFKPMEKKPNQLEELRRQQASQYKSLMEEAIKNGTFNSTSDGKGTAKETLKYTGNLIVGIATMHKSNAVPVMKGTNQAEEIAKMRRS